MLQTGFSHFNHVPGKMVHDRRDVGGFVRDQCLPITCIVRGEGAVANLDANQPRPVQVHQNLAECSIWDQRRVVHSGLLQDLPRQRQ